MHAYIYIYIYIYKSFQMLYIYIYTYMNELSSLVSGKAKMSTNESKYIMPLIPELMWFTCWLSGMILSLM